VQEDECIADKLVMALCLSVCVNTMVLGLHEVRLVAPAWSVHTRAMQPEALSVWCSLSTGVHPRRPDRVGGAAHPVGRV
jgi:hypothetical protein